MHYDTNVFFSYICPSFPVQHLQPQSLTPATPCPSPSVLVPVAAVPGRFREIAESELSGLPSSWSEIQTAIQDLSEGELDARNARNVLALAALGRAGVAVFIRWFKGCF